MRSAVLLLLVACTATPERGGGEATGAETSPGSTLREPAAVTLTAASPRAKRTVAAAVVAERPPILELRVRRIDNPEHLPFAVGLTLRTDTDHGAREILVGGVTPHPPDRAARFLLRASDAWNRLDPHPGEAVTLLLKLVAIQEVELKKLALTVEVAWREEARAEGTIPRMCRGCATHFVKAATMAQQRRELGVCAAAVPTAVSAPTIPRRRTNDLLPDISGRLSRLTTNAQVEVGARDEALLREAGNGPGLPTLRARLPSQSGRAHRSQRPRVGPR